MKDQNLIILGTELRTTITGALLFCVSLSVVMHDGSTQQAILVVFISIFFFYFSFERLEKVLFAFFISVRFLEAAHFISIGHKLNHLDTL